MATIRDSAFTIFTTTTASMVCEMPTHETGDLLVACVAKDGASAFTTPTGWTLIRSGISAGAAGGIYCKRAASSSETVTFALTIDTCVGAIIAAKDVEAQIDSGAGALTINVNSGAATFTRTTGSFDTDGFLVGQCVEMSGFTNAGNNGAKTIVSITGSGTIMTVTSEATLVTETGSGNERVISLGAGISAKNGSDDSTMPFTGIGLTTGPLGNSLLIHAWVQDTTSGTSHLPPWVNIFAGDAAAGGMSVAYSFEPTASTAITAPELWGGTADDGRGYMIEIRDGSSGTVKPPYIPLGTVPSVLISPLTGSDGAVDRGTYVAAASIAITSVAGKTVTGVTFATTADSGYNPFRGSMRNAGVSSTTNLNHTEINMTATQDVTTGGLIFGTYLNLAPRDYVDTGKATQGGVYFLAGSSSANWRAWVVGGQFSKTERADARNNFLIEPNVSTTQYASAGTPNWASLDYMAFGSAGYYGQPAILWNELWEVRTAIIAGGTSTNPFNFDSLITTVNSGCGNIPLMQQSGALATVWTPIQFGGNENIGIECNLNTFQFPRVADEIDYVDFHLSADKIGIEFYGTGSSDMLNFTNCLFTSPSSYYWRFNSSHSASTVMDFSGSTVVGANVTLRSTVTLDSLTFISCGTFTQNSATLTNCAFTDTKVTSSAPGAADNISDSSFTSTGTGHGIEIGGTAADMTLTNVDFSGYAGTNGSTGNEAIYVNIASGSMTINISGGTTPSIRTAGATVTVLNAVTVKVTVKDATSLAVIEGARVLMEAASIATGTHTGSDGAATLTDASQSFTVDELVGYRIYNTTDGSDGSITANTATTVTATLAGGTQNDWDTSDAYIIVALPAQNPVSIASSGTTATVTHRNHGLATGAQVVIRGATDDIYNGIFTISSVSTNAYDYTMPSDPAGSAATGSPTSTAVILSDVTDEFGILQTTSFNYTYDQPITGKVRKATTGTKYKTGTLTGTITSTGLDTTLLLIADE